MPAIPAEGSATRAAVGQRHGVDLRRVSIDRSATSAAQAARLGARAYTSAQGVVIPPQVGTLDAGEGQALLAHELTHVAQRTRLGAAMPPEHTPAGQTLEAEARTAELALAPPSPGAASALGSPRHHGPTTPAGGAAAGQGRPAAPGSLALATATPAARNPAIDETALLAAMRKLAQATSTTPPPGQPTTIVMNAPPAAPAPVPAAAAVQRAPDVVTRALAAPTRTSAEPLLSAEPTDEELSQLAHQLYPIISYRIKGELREDRDRAGLLTDTYRRW
jgi:hypothetical protein